ncbi:hypothetical protein H9Q73_004968 [Fusarium xylarioides]|nr:hypothetical protein H9Q73_004968 [Fusarium xylarioides]
MSERTPLLESDHENQNYGSSSRDTVKTSEQDGEIAIICKELSFARLAMIMSTAWLGVFLGAADTTVIATLSAQISSEFNSLSLLSWLTTAYLIANAASQPISGRLTDIFGRGPGLAFSNIAFAVGNLICTNQKMMILGRVISGIGGGGLMSIPTFLGSDLVPLRKRGLVGGIANIWYASGAMVGAVFGGFLNDYTSWGWRMAFLIQVFPSLLSAIIVYSLIKVPPKQSDKSYVKRIDFGGVFLVSSFLASLVLGTGIFAVQNDLTPAWMTCLAFFIIGLGYNAVFSITQVACVAAVGHAQQAVVTSITYLARSLGGTIGITLASVLYQSSLDMSLWARFGHQPNATEEIRRIKDDLCEIHHLPEGWYSGVMESLMQAFGHVWLTMLPWAVLALISISPIKQHKLFSTLDRK